MATIQLSHNIPGPVLNALSPYHGSELSVVPILLGVKAELLIMAHKALHDLACHLQALISTHSSFYSVSFSYTGLVVSQTHKARARLRALRQAVSSFWNAVPSIICTTPCLISSRSLFKFPSSGRLALTFLSKLVTTPESVRLG